MQISHKVSVLIKPAQSDTGLEGQLKTVLVASRATYLINGESRLERCCCRSTGAWYLGCQYLLAFTKADMADTKRTYWWLSRICRRTFDK